MKRSYSFSFIYSLSLLCNKWSIFFLLSKVCFFFYFFLWTFLMGLMNKDNNNNHFYALLNTKLAIVWFTSSASNAMQTFHKTLPYFCCWRSSLALVSYHDLDGGGLFLFLSSSVLDTDFEEGRKRTLEFITLTT